MQTSRWAARAAERAQVKAGRQYAQWVSTSWRSSPGLVHRHVKGEGPAQLETLQLEEAVADPMKQMQIREDHWTAVWRSRSFDETKLQRWLARTARRAQEEELPPLTLPQVKQTLASLSPKKAMGADALRSSDVARLPDESVQQWVHLLQEVEAAVLWPRGDRTIGLLLPLLVKCWSRTRATVTDEWSEALEQHWDTAIRGSNALRAALCRSVLDERTVTMSFCAIEALVDLEKFFDSIDLIALLEVAEQEAYPAVVISLEAQAYLAPGRLRRHGWSSGAISAERSIVAGSNHGVKVGKLFLYPLLQRVSAGSPAVGLQTFVDDTILRTDGLKRAAVDQMVVALKRFGECCQAAKLTSSDKSVIVASDMDAAQQVVGGAGGPSLPLKAVEKAVDLGVSTTAGKRRDQSQFHKRAKTVARRMCGIHRMRRKVRLGEYTKMLHKRGHNRRQASRAIAGKGFGRCLTTTLALTLDEDDPGLALPRQLLGEWMQLWRRHPEHRQRVQRAWRLLYQKLKALPQARRWARVRGAISVVICTLLTAGWDVPSATTWHSDVEETWQISEDMEADDTELLDEFTASIKRAWWAKAARHDAGEGLVDGADLHQARRHLARLQRDGEHGTWALQLQVMTGASWTRVRQKEADFDVSATCPLCGLADETLLHRVWQCPCNVGHEDYTSMESLAARAVEGAAAEPCLWLRGLPPTGWTRYEYPEGASEFEHVAGDWDTAAEQYGGEDGFLDVFGDGSGGEHSDDPRLRQCGVGAVILQVSLQAPGELRVAAGVAAGLLGPKQTVPRSELQAFLIALRRTRGCLRYHTDHMPLVHGWRQRRHVSPSGKNADLWWQIRRAIRDRGDSDIEIRFLHSHQEKHLIGNESAQQLFVIAGNMFADEFEQSAAATVLASVTVKPE
ncbi:unnamed protein product, partial [Prorocentrum cordatum]